jgi:hypothetical protein
MENVFVLKKIVSLHCIYIKQEEDMNANTLELEARKAELAREILGETDKNRLNEWLAFFKKKKNVSVRSYRQDRKIGLLDGKIKIVFSDDFEMTTEELIGIK